MVDALNRVAPEYLEALVERSVDRLLQRFVPVAQRMLGPGKLTFGEFDLSPEETLAQILHDRDTGLLQAMADTPEAHPELRRTRQRAREALRKLESQR